MAEGSLSTVGGAAGLAWKPFPRLRGAGGSWRSRALTCRLAGRLMPALVRGALTVKEHVITFTPVEPILEPAAREFAEATSTPPFHFDLAPAEGRKAVEEVQSTEVDKPEVDENWVAVSGGPKGSVAVRIVRPKGATGPLPAILYIHGAGWVFGSAHTHVRLVRELARGAQAATVLRG